MAGMTTKSLKRRQWRCRQEAGRNAGKGGELARKTWVMLTWMWMRARDSRRKKKLTRVRVAGKRVKRG